MSKRATSHEIDDAAAQWVARSDRGHLSSEDTQALDAWLAEDIRHRGAYAKAQAVFTHFDRAGALGPDFDPTHFYAAQIPQTVNEMPQTQPDWLTRRRMFGMAASIAVLGTAGAFGFAFYDSGHYRTRRGEVRMVPLADGSVVTLNTASWVSVHFTDTDRHVRLLEGEALFDVAKDSRRPFIVKAGDTQVHAIGTSFTVRRLGTKPIEVLVQEGVVEVTRPTAPVAAPVRVAANTRAVAEKKPDAAATTAAVAPAGVARELAWREGMIAFEAATLEEAAMEFARYSDTKIIITDIAVAHETVTGLFSAHNPIGFAQAAAVSLGLRAEVRDSTVYLKR